MCVDDSRVRMVHPRDCLWDGLQYADARKIIARNFSGSACDIATAKYMQLVVEEVLKTHRV